MRQRAGQVRGDPRGGSGHEGSLRSGMEDARPLLGRGHCWAGVGRGAPRALRAQSVSAGGRGPSPWRPSWAVTAGLRGCGVPSPPDCGCTCVLAAQESVFRKQLPSD